MAATNEPTALLIGGVEMTPEVAADLAAARLRRLHNDLAEPCAFIVLLEAVTSQAACDPELAKAFRRHIKAGAKVHPAVDLDNKPGHCRLKGESHLGDTFTFTVRATAAVVADRVAVCLHVTDADLPNTPDDELSHFQRVQKYALIRNAEAAKKAEERTLRANDTFSKPTPAAMPTRPMRPPAPTRSDTERAA